MQMATLSKNIDRRNDLMGKPKGDETAQFLGGLENGFQPDVFPDFSAPNNGSDDELSRAVFGKCD